MSDSTSLAIYIVLIIGLPWLGFDGVSISYAIDRQTVALTHIADAMDKPLQLKEPVKVELTDASGIAADALADKPGRKR